MTQANLRSSARPSYLHCRGNFREYTKSGTSQADLVKSVSSNGEVCSQE